MRKYGLETCEYRWDYEIPKCVMKSNTEEKLSNEEIAPEKKILKRNE